MELQVHESVLKKYHSIVTVTFNLFCNSVDEIKQRTTSGLESSRSITSKFPLLCTGQNSSSPPSLLSGSIWLIPAGRVTSMMCVSSMTRAGQSQHPAAPTVVTIKGPCIEMAEPKVKAFLAPLVMGGSGPRELLGGSKPLGYLSS